MKLSDTGWKKTKTGQVREFGPSLVQMTREQQKSLIIESVTSEELLSRVACYEEEFQGCWFYRLVYTAPPKLGTLPNPLGAEEGVEK